MIQGGLRVGIRSSLGTDYDADSLKLFIPQPQFLRNRYGQRDMILDKEINSHQTLLNRTFLGCQVFEM
jgi:hypothetical protein